MDGTKECEFYFPVLFLSCLFAPRDVNDVFFGVCVLVVCQREPREMKTRFHFRASADSFEFTNSISNFLPLVLRTIYLFSFQRSSGVFHRNLGAPLHSPPPAGNLYVEVRVNFRQAIRSDGRKSIYEVPYPVKR